ncbi:hypothetical protein V0R50_26390 [Pseudomonas sp. 148P]|uniref:Uncharacterized protein n=1 Tax=Pseudomonas ulcerans TaxID=3115852 RepID=A0ABU7HYX6_9PSED|nr:MULTISPECIES: hypothetical protein [unclassified Pseudomonas]MEE1925313.1 hypothetical protein [Pseudomonas sp. 147P]MEE1936767.1 hypothetical protein [Pseudomonas sp. 148P]
MISTEAEFKKARIATRALLVGWLISIPFSWLTSLALFYSDLPLSSDLHRWLPIIARAEAYFIAHDQLDFLKRAAWIYEKDLALFAIMLLWLALTCRFVLKESFIGFLRWRNYRRHYPYLLFLLAVAAVVTMMVVGPAPGDTGFRLFNRLYSFSVYSGACHTSQLLPFLPSLVAIGIAPFLEPVEGRETR